MQRHSQSVNGFAVVTAIIAFTCILSMTCVSGAPLKLDIDALVKLSNDTVKFNDKNETTSRLLINGLFEGDLKLSEETILRYYNFSSVPGGDKLYEEMMEARESEGESRASGIGESEIKHNRKERGAGNDIGLWSDNIVRYEISSSISSSTANLIRDAMDHLEENSCLRFMVRSGQSDYIEFDNTNDGCYSSIGRQGGMQTINLEQNDATGFGCEHFGVIVHEIVHAIGFWHEQSRPDRDNYVTINTGNIRNGKEHNFMTRNNIDSLGSGYDYGSIMHYQRDEFVRDGCTGCTTIDVNNAVEYSNQGSPTLGQRDALSTRDIEQINSLYHCPRARLRVNVRYARNLEDTDPWLNDPDPYVRVNAVTSATAVHSLNSREIGGTRDPTWNQWLDFGCERWVVFRIQIWDEDGGFTGSDDEMSTKETVIAQLGTHQTLRHNAFDGGHLIYDYELISNSDSPCSPNPCQHGGTCTDRHCGEFSCSCISGWGGTHCQHLQGNLRIYARYGRDLPDEDGWWNDSDPYIEFIAIDVNGNSVRMTTSTRSGDEDPDWNQWLYFGTRAWREFKVRVYDDDYNADDPLSSQQTWTLSSHTSQTYVRHNCYSGYVKFDYHFN